MTDANIVTGLDISNSIGPEQIKLELAGMAQAICDQRVLQAIAGGKHGRIGFAVFAWHYGQFPTVVSWMVIGSAQEAQVAARALEARELIDVELEGRAQTEWYIGRLTDLSEAIDFADRALSMAPTVSDRAVINIVGNGEDNVGEDAGIARDRAVLHGRTVNGIVLGRLPDMTEYYRGQVMGGPHAFVMSIDADATMTDAFVRKFIGDIIAGNAGPDTRANPLDHQPMP
ncbi:MAG: DUF1194 domain-containing protein [Dongiaceae bacterium]